MRGTPVGGGARLFTFSVRKEGSRQMGSILNGMTAEGGRRCDGPRGIHRPHMLVTVIQV